MSAEHITVRLRWDLDDEHPMVKTMYSAIDGEESREDFLCRVLNVLLVSANKKSTWARLSQVPLLADGASPQTTRTASPTSNT